VTRSQGNGEGYILLSKYYSGDQPRRMRWPACGSMVDRRDAYKVLRRKTGGKRPFESPRCRWEDNIKMDVQEMRWEHGLD